MDMLQKFHKALESVLNDHAAYFRCQLSKTNVTKYVIDTSDDTPVKVPPYPIPFHYSEQLQRQLKGVAKKETTKPSNSLWCAPAVYVPKKNGEIRICVGFVQLNKATK